MPRSDSQSTPGTHLQHELTVQPHYAPGPVMGFLQVPSPLTLGYLTQKSGIEHGLY